MNIYSYVVHKHNKTGPVTFPKRMNCLSGAYRLKSSFPNMMELECKKDERMRNSNTLDFSVGFHYICVL